MPGSITRSKGETVCAPKGSLGGNQPIIRGGHDDCGGWGSGACGGDAFQRFDLEGEVD
jgi:hypothetical protein